jgi:putative toxin-antitoxin system antitoxin component (TIGR02293 family)
MTKARIYRPEIVTARKSSQEAVVRQSAFRAVFGHEIPSDELAKSIRAGFPVSVVGRLQEVLEAPQGMLLKIVHISPSTLTRRRGKTTTPRLSGKGMEEPQRLTPDESGRIYRVTAVLEDAMRLFEGDREAALRWLKQPAKALGGATPLSYLDTEAGADAVRDLIGRLEYGVIT